MLLAGARVSQERAIFWAAYVALPGRYWDWGGCWLNKNLQLDVMRELQQGLILAVAGLSSVSARLTMVKPLKLVEFLCV